MTLRFAGSESSPIPKVTILIPIYNGSTYIGATLASLIEQSFVDFQVLCLDDCSTDNSRDIVAAVVAADPRFELIVSDINCGSVSPVINAVLDRVETEFVVYSSQDDRFSPDWLKSMIEREEETGADSILPDLIFVNANSTAINEIIGFRGDRSVVLSNVEAVTASLDWTIHGLAMWRSAIVKKYRFAEFSAYADEYSAREFFFACNKVAFCEGKFYSTQDNPQAITKKPSYRMFDVPRTAMAVHDLLCRKNFPLAVRSVQFLRSFNIFVGMCRIAWTDADNFPAGDFARSKASLRGFYASLPPGRMVRLMILYRSQYRTRTFVKLLVFVFTGRLIEALAVHRLRRSAGRANVLSK